MSEDEFDKIWRLLQTLWPNAAAKKGSNDKIVWQRALTGYTMADVSDRIMDYAQSNKFFPDVADITKNLFAVKDANAEAEIIRAAKLCGKIFGVETPDFQTKDEAMTWFRGLEVGV